ncbi:MFS transporter [Arthrobacter sp. NPDC090010]|uniref:MFS transporter n=1 Tax=Arthrobacter sp. NPDC090010 TaxID=3363942 RepID=UPI0037FCFE2F
MTKPWFRAACALFVIAWGGNHFTPLLHLYEVRFGYSEVMVDVFLGTYVAGLIPGLLLGGALSDRHGRRPVVLAGVLLSVLASAILGPGSSSAVAMCLGRCLAGASVGIAMSVGSSWVKELTVLERVPGRPAWKQASAGARRPALALTLGFGLGAGVSGSIAQWGPLPSLLPYAVHVVLGLLALVSALRVPETVRSDRAVPRTRLLDDLRVPLAGHRRFLRVVLPAAPWVFATAGIGYAVIPLLQAPHLGQWTLAYATGLTVLTLGVGAVVQPFVPKIDVATGGRASVVGLLAMSFGMLLAAGSAVLGSPWLGALAAAVLGAAYGTTLVSGLMEVQVIAGPADLAGLTGVYYSLSYVGFLLPIVLASLAPAFSYPVMLLGVTVLCLGCLGVLSWGLRSASR